MEKHLVFVYGTLKRGFRANGMLSSSDFISEGQTLLNFSIVGSSFPMAFLDKNGYPVKGEVYSVSTEIYRVLDRYEGYPGFYSRKPFPIKTKDGNLVANMYYFPEERSGQRLEPKNGVLEWT